jgi:hypothetical protein
MLPNRRPRTGAHTGFAKIRAGKSRASSERILRAQLAANTGWAFTQDRTGLTAVSGPVPGHIGAQQPTATT